MRGLRSRASRTLLATLAALQTLALQACIPGPDATHDEMNAIERFSYDVPDLGLTVRALRAGDPTKPRIIYIHGTPGDAKAFADYLRDPLPGFEHVAIDRPGFGQTRPTDGSKPSPVTSFQDQARAIEPLLIEQGGAYPILVGHSLGGPIIARAAADFPDRVAGLVIVAGSLDPALEKPRWFNHLANTWLARPLIGRTMRTSNDEIMDAPRETTRLDRFIRRVVCPVAIVHGTTDSLVPIENVDYMRRAFDHTDVRVDIIEGKGHFVLWSHGDRVINAIAWASSTPSPETGDAIRDPRQTPTASSDITPSDTR